MEHVLILAIFYFGYGVSVTSTVFSGEHACGAAGVAAYHALSTPVRVVSYVCTPK